MQVEPKFRPGDKCVVRDNMNRSKLWYLRNDERNLEGQVVTIKNVAGASGYKGEAYDYRIEEDDWGFIGENDLETVPTVKDILNVDLDIQSIGSISEVNIAGEIVPQYDTSGKETKVAFNYAQVQEAALWLELHSVPRQDYNDLILAIYEDMQMLSEQDDVDMVSRMGYHIAKEVIFDGTEKKVVSMKVLVDMAVAVEASYLEGTFDKDGNLVVKFPHDL